MKIATYDVNLLCHNDGSLLVSVIKRTYERGVHLNTELVRSRWCTPGEAVAVASNAAVEAVALVRAEYEPYQETQPARGRQEPLPLGGHGGS